MSQPELQSATQPQMFCLMCDRDTPFSSGLTFKLEIDGSVSATFTGNSSLQGYEGIMHGGVLSALLDTAMAQCLLKQNVKAVTGDLHIRYLHQVSCDDKLRIKAWIDSSLPPLHHLKSQIRVGPQIVCRGKAKFMELQAEKPASKPGKGDEK